MCGYLSYKDFLNLFHLLSENRYNPRCNTLSYDSTETFCESIREEVFRLFERYNDSDILKFVKENMLITDPVERKTAEWIGDEMRLYLVEEGKTLEQAIKEWLQRLKD